MKKFLLSILAILVAGALAASGRYVWTQVSLIRTQLAEVSERIDRVNDRFEIRVMRTEGIRYGKTWSDDVPQCPEGWIEAQGSEIFNHYFAANTPAEEKPGSEMFFGYVYLNWRLRIRVV